VIVFFLVIKYKNSHLHYIYVYVKNEVPEILVFRNMYVEILAYF